MDSSESRSDSPFRIEDLNAPASNVPQITANLHPHAAAELHKVRLLSNLYFSVG